MDLFLVFEKDRGVILMRFALTVLFLLLSTMQLLAEQITIFATCKTYGLLEQCGCVTDIEGGVEARAAYLQKAKQDNPHSILVDTGGFMPLQKSRQKKAFLLSNESAINWAIGQTNIKAMQMMKYDVIVPAVTDLEYGEKLREGLDNFSLLATTVQTPVDWVVSSKVVSRGDMKIGFVGAPSLKTLPRSVGKPFRISSPDEAIATTSSELKTRSNVDAVVLLVHEPPPVVTHWLAGYKGPKIDLIIALDFGLSVKKFGDTYLVNATSKGRSIGKIDLDIEKKKGITNIAFQRVSLNPLKYRDQAMRDFLSGSYSKLAQLSKPSLQNPPVLMDLDMEQASDNSYAGSQACMSCHLDEYEQWKKTKHATAFYTLLEANRHFVPYCIQCHVTGYTHPGGFQGYPDKQGMENVQCEVCHGPGQKHVDEFGTGDIRLTSDKTVCLECHTESFSPKFLRQFDLYYKQVKH